MLTHLASRVLLGKASARCLLTFTKLSLDVLKEASRVPSVPSFSPLARSLVGIPLGGHSADVMRARVRLQTAIGSPDNAVGPHHQMPHLLIFRGYRGSSLISLSGTSNKEQT